MSRPRPPPPRLTVSPNSPQALQKGLPIESRGRVWRKLGRIPPRWVTASTGKVAPRVLLRSLDVGVGKQARQLSAWTVWRRTISEWSRKGESWRTRRKVPPPRPIPRRPAGATRLSSLASGTVPPPSQAAAGTSAATANRTSSAATAGKPAVALQVPQSPPADVYAYAVPAPPPAPAPVVAGKDKRLSSADKAQSSTPALAPAPKRCNGRRHGWNGRRRRRRRRRTWRDEVAGGISCAGRPTRRVWWAGRRSPRCGGSLSRG